MGPFHHALVKETIEALRRNVEALRELEQEGVPDPEALASLEAARSILIKAQEVVGCFGELPPA
ncbi:hypothetical protein [Sphingomonas alba]|uniref:Uncharacterized protein n=1 Tax=Sphingomonas alba TaxID=2908208 RepID=A0ABT0RLY7_9SPHN|nr:hypothetical protein [Sphingomonas alba]MCL6683667.1 hypothetical protein [Sphingomonas alba]